jgi:hypothetical protein
MTDFLHNDEAIFHDETTDVFRLNQLLDDLTEKRFITVNVFVAAVRGALDLHGITLPMLDVEGAHGYDKTGASVEDGKFVQAGITDGSNVDMYAPPVDGEFIFNVKDIHDTDGPSDIYLYMLAEREEDGVYACYAQLVNGDELEELMSSDPLDDEFPELVGDIAGETDWLKQQRHLNGGARDVDEAPPQG